MRRSVLALGALVMGVAVACARQGSDALPADDGGGFGDSKRACDADGNAIIVVSARGDIYRFSPGTRAFQRLSRAACQPIAQPGMFATGRVMGAAVDRRGIAWLSYAEYVLPESDSGADDSGLEGGVSSEGPTHTSAVYPVSIVDGACGAPVPFDMAAFTGWAFSAAVVPGILLSTRLVATDTDASPPRVDVSLSSLDTSTGRVSAPQQVGPIERGAEPIEVAITQASDGTIVGYFNALHEPYVHPYFVTISPTNGRLARAPGSVPHIDTRILSTNAPDPPSALVLWGGERWLFTGDPATRQPAFTASASMVTRIPNDGTASESVKRELDFLVVGAGIVPCEGGPALR